MVVLLDVLGIELEVDLKYVVFGVLVVVNYVLWIDIFVINVVLLVVFVVKVEVC